MSALTMQDEFEAAFRKEFGFGRMTASSNPDAAQMLKAAEWAWKASRTALVIELPTIHRDDYANTYGFNCAVEAIDAAKYTAKRTGLKVAP